MTNQQPFRSAGRACCAVVLLAITMLFAATPAHAATRYFKVAEWNKPFHGDSYVLPLSDPADIAHAQDLINLGPGAAGESIVVAAIAPGSDGINRDFNQPGNPAWSWHVTAFVSFADVTIEILDGWPTYVENDVPGWIANTNGHVGFWSYTVVEDVTSLVVPEPGTLALLTLGGAALIRRRRR